MRFIKIAAYKLSFYLAKELEDGHDKRRAYYYGLRIVMGGVLKGVALVLVAILIGILKPTMIIVFTFSSMRSIAGGYHMDSFGKCMAASLMLFWVFGLITKYTYSYWTLWAIICLILLTFITAVYVIVKYAPKDNPNRKITDPGAIKRFKIMSLIYICAWLIVASVLGTINQYLYAIATSFGIILETFSIIPMGYKFFDTINCIRFKKT